MTKKDYILLADAIKNTQNLSFLDTEYKVKQVKQEVADIIATALAKDNYRFDWDKWDNYIFPKAD